MSDSNKEKELTHDLINKLVSAQGFLKVLEKSNLDEGQKKLTLKTEKSLLEALVILKDYRKELK